MPAEVTTRTPSGLVDRQVRKTPEELNSHVIEPNGLPGNGCESEGFESVSFTIALLLAYASLGNQVS